MAFDRSWYDNAMFVLKKILAPFFMPVSVVFILTLAGLFCLYFTRRQKAGKVLVAVAFGFLGLLSYDQVSNMLARPLEQEYPPLINMEYAQGVKWIVVLGGGSQIDESLPASTYLSEASLFRLLRGGIPL
ncbi:MAG: hypothetical protein U5R49_06545 [Deltaproteobacteria bacterium]|nr:hypothetical protein [Deltaproteobacteria bacterium]